MKQRIYRYIAIAFGVLAVIVAYVEINVSGIPFFAFICVLAAKQFYDDSIGKVTAGGDDNRARFNSAGTAHSSWADDDSYNSWTKSLSRGEYPGGGTTDPFD